MISVDNLILFSIDINELEEIECIYMTTLRVDYIGFI